MKTALYTTILSSRLPYVQTWSDSVMKQSDQDFDLWIAVDNLDKTVIPKPRDNVQWFTAQPKDTVAQIREAVFSEMITAL